MKIKKEDLFCILKERINKLSNGLVDDEFGEVYYISDILNNIIDIIHEEN